MCPTTTAVVVPDLLLPPFSACFAGVKTAAAMAATQTEIEIQIWVGSCDRRDDHHHGGRCRRTVVAAADLRPRSAPAHFFRDLLLNFYFMFVTT